MSQDLLIAIIVIASVLLLSRLLSAWAHAGSRNKRRRKQRARVAPSHNPFEAVSCEGDCQALRGLRGRRFLVREAPRLPVHGCNASHCHCRYVHHKDRRSGGDRRGAHGLRNELFEYTGVKDRRGDARSGRRRSDLAYG